MRRSRIRFLGLAAAFLALTQVATAGSKTDKKDASEPFKRLSVDEVEKRLADASVHVYDGNTDEVYREGHLRGAVHLISRDIKEGVLPAGKNTPLIFYCHNTL